MKKRTLKFIAIFVTLLTVILITPSAFVLHLNGNFFTIDHREFASSFLRNQERELDDHMEPDQEQEHVSLQTPSSALPFEPNQEDESENGSEAVPEQDQKIDQELESEPEQERIITVTISAVGDITIGGCPARNSYSTFMREFEANNNDHTYLFRNVRHIFTESDLTIGNFEGTLTDETRHGGKNFNFRAPPEFVMSLIFGGFDVVTLANNHSLDYFEKGYNDTIDTLDSAGIASFGNARNTIVEVNGINVGFFGFMAWADTGTHRNNITSAIDDLKSRGAELIIAYFHWGVETHYRPSATQRNLGRFTIDSGADLVLGAHPHVIQGIEIYNGRNIVYSLANFSFGGNRRPFDMDTFIFQQTFTFDNGVLLDTNETNLIPARVTSARNYNNYQPTPAEGQDAERILLLLERLNSELNR